MKIFNWITATLSLVAAIVTIYDWLKKEMYL